MHRFSIFVVLAILASAALPARSQNVSRLSQKVQENIYEARRCLEIVRTTNQPSEKLFNLQRAIQFADEAAKAAPGDPGITRTIDELVSFRPLVVTEGLNTARHLIAGKEADGILQAFELVESVLEIDPDNAQARSLRADVLRTLQSEQKNDQFRNPDGRYNTLMQGRYERVVQAMSQCRWQEASEILYDLCSTAPWITSGQENASGWARIPAWQLRRFAGRALAIQEHLKQGARFYGLEDGDDVPDHGRAADEFAAALSNIQTLSEEMEMGSTNLLTELRSQEEGYGWFLQTEYLARRFLGILQAEQYFIDDSESSKELTATAAVHLARAAAYAFPAKPAGPKDSKLHYWLGRCLLEQGHRQSALAALGTSVRILPPLPALKGDDAHPAPAKARYLRIRLWFQVHSFQLGLLIASLLALTAGLFLTIKTILITRRSAVPVLHLATKNHRADRLPEARESYEFALKQAKADDNNLLAAVIMNCLGVVHARLGHLDKAEKLFANAAESFPSLPHSTLNLATLRAGDPVAAPAVHRLIKRSFLAAFSGEWSGIPDSDLMLLRTVGTVFPADTVERKLSNEIKAVLAGERSI